MITEDAFWKYRAQYEAELTPEIEKNGAETIRRANLLLQAFYAADKTHSKRNSNSGWRPPEINAKTKRAAKKSKHMLGLAVDIADTTGVLKKWLMTKEGQVALVEIGLWMEHPSHTATWAHVQTVPPGSGNRVFYP